MIAVQDHNRDDVTKTQLTCNQQSCRQITNTLLWYQKTILNAVHTKLSKRHFKHRHKVHKTDHCPLRQTYKLNMYN